MAAIKWNDINVEEISTNVFTQRNITVNVLRLDQIDPLISGNKWFKLKAYLQQAQSMNKKVIVTFGGAYSNHIHATAAACKIFGLSSVGIIRGERPKILSPTLSDAVAWDMDLFFVSRSAYQQKQIPLEVLSQYEDIYIINEGGYGVEGMQGAQSILHDLNKQEYTHICAAVGTGTTLAGLITAAMPHQQIVGISVLKNNFALEADIQKLTGRNDAFTINHNYHFGGYAKSTPQLFHFMNHWFEQTGIPSDFVYTGKLFYAVHNLIEKSFFPEGSNILVVHSGGLQGNRSLPKGTLIF